jgi:hypothetical protein
VGVTAGTAYDVRVASVRAKGATSTYTETDNYTVTASSSGIDGSQIVSGTVSASYLPTATSSTLGIVKPDNSTITISSGVISSVGGGGSSSYPAVPFTAPPSASGLTKVDATGGSSTASNITSGAILFKTIAFSGTNDHMLLKSVPATPYTFTVCIAVDAQSINYSTCGVFRTDGTKVQLFGLQYSTGWNYTVANHSTVNSYSSSPYNSATATAMPINLIWLQLEDDGTNVHFRVSANGADFSEELFSQSNTSFLTATQIGIGIDNESNTAGNMVCMSWDGV